MSASETIKRLRSLDCYLAPDCSVAVPLTDLRALLDLAEAAERLRGEYANIEPWWAEWEQAEMEYAGFWTCRWCDWEDGEGNPYSVRHLDACPAIALDRALDALGGE